MLSARCILQPIFSTHTEQLNMAKITVPGLKGPLSVECYAQFHMVIDGQAFEFAVTHDVNMQDKHKCVTHLASGKRVCAASVGGAYLRKVDRPSDHTIGEWAMKQVVEKHGGKKVADLLRAATPSPTAGEPAATDAVTSGPQAHMDRFESILADRYRALFAAFPSQYMGAMQKHTPESLAALMTRGLAATPVDASKEGKGIEQTCKILGIKHTYKAIKAYFISGAL